MRYMIKNAVLAAAVLALLGSAACSGVSPYRYWNIYGMTQPERTTEKVFRDDVMDIQFYIDEKKIHFRLENLTDEPLTIDWSRAAYVHIDGAKHKVANSGSIFSERKDDPAPSIIEPGGRIEDFAAPSKNVEKIEELTWYCYPLFNLMDEDAYENRGKTFGLDMPVQANGQWKTYSFRFEITNVVPGVRRII